MKNRKELGSDLEYLWVIYAEIIKGCERITYASIKDYQDMIGADVTPWESSVLIDIDLIRRKNG